jgi:hypothetical protein
MGFARFARFASVSLGFKMPGAPVLPARPATFGFTGVTGQAWCVPLKPRYLWGAVLPVLPVLPAVTDATLKHNVPGVKLTE